MQEHGRHGQGDERPRPEGSLRQWPQAGQAGRQPDGDVPQHLGAQDGKRGQQDVVIAARLQRRLARSVGQGEQQPPKQQEAPRPLAPAHDRLHDPQHENGPCTPGHVPRWPARPHGHHRPAQVKEQVLGHVPPQAAQAGRLARRCLQERGQAQAHVSRQQGHGQQGRQQRPRPSPRLVPQAQEVVNSEDQRCRHPGLAAQDRACCQNQRARPEQGRPSPPEAIAFHPQRQGPQGEGRHQQLGDGRDPGHGVHRQRVESVAQGGQSRQGRPSQQAAGEPPHQGDVQHVQTDVDQVIGQGVQAEQARLGQHRQVIDRPVQLASDEDALSAVPRVEDSLHVPRDGGPRRAPDVDEVVHHEPVAQGRDEEEGRQRQRQKQVARLLQAGYHRLPLLAHRGPGFRPAPAGRRSGGRSRRPVHRCGRCRPPGSVPPGWPRTAGPRSRSG
ncbi:hypothetical protein HRbin24_01854 [bacterium HR24]|nr:hypothetical protein HRbin24_01854 [bacterium HR24]